ncbi:MAG TPA: selenocysteine synthase [Bryobacteraceae bacterium]|nr:selenocysteine synthase [Bryobacteraceae bacterium]
MASNRTRRNFFGMAGAALAVSTSQAAPAGATAKSGRTAEGHDYYEKLGVTKIINAAGTYTFLTASIMPLQVQAAVMQAAKNPVRLNELQKATGEYLAKRLQCEGALVTAGAASALTLGTAACMTVANPAAVKQMPTNMDGLKNEVVVQKAHRYDYDHALLNCGIRFVEVETLDQYQNAFTDKTVMAHFFNAAEGGQISREDWIRVAHQHNVPCFNDAAADVPPISNLWNYTKMGFDLVTFSGGKGIRGPQNAGLLLGRKDLIVAAVANDMPISEAIGRGMKVAKEQIVGMVAAVDWFLEQSDEGMEKEFRHRGDTISNYLKTVPTLRSQIVIPEVANHVPHLLLNYDRNRIKIGARDVAEQLRRGNPSIELNPATGQVNSRGLTSEPDTIVVGVWMLQPGEEMIVAKRLHEVLMQAASAA